MAVIHENNVFMKQSTGTYTIIYIYKKIYCTEIRCSTCGVTKLLLQPIYNIITSCIHVGKSKTY